MNSVERLVYYSNDLETEAEPIIPDHRPPSEWPDKGQIEINDLVVQYGPDNPPVLKSISLEVKPAEKIGIVGRTGILYKILIKIYIYIFYFTFVHTYTHIYIYH